MTKLLGTKPNQAPINADLGDLAYQDGANSQIGPITVTGGNVGIGTSSPDGRLHVQNGSAGTVTANVGARTLVVEGSATTGISVLVPDNADANVYLGSESDSAVGFIRAEYDQAKMTVATGITGGVIDFLVGQQSHAMRIDSSGNVGIGTTSPSALLDVDGTTRLGGAVTLGGTLDMNGNTLTVDTATFNEGGEAKFLAAGTVSTDQSYDETTERDIQMTVSAAVNLDFETPNSGMVYSHVLWITQDGTGGRVVTIRDGSNTEATWIGDEPSWSGLAAAALTKVSVFYSPSGTLYAMEFDAP